MISVLALAGIGIGYAGFTDTITVSGYIECGYLDYEIVWYSNHWWYKELSTGELFEFDQEQVNNPDLYLVATGQAGPGDLEDVDFTFWNLFPCVWFYADFIFHYTGSIPVKINDIVFNFPGGIWDGYLEYDVVMYEAFYDAANNEYTWDDTVEIGLGWQMENCDYVYVEVWVHIIQLEGVNDLQGQTCDFDGSIELVQWNEYPHP